MRSGWNVAAMGLLLTTAVGCGRLPLPHRAAPQAQAQAPSLPPAQMASLTPSMPPVPPYAPAKPVMLDTNAPSEAQPTVAEAPKSHSHHRTRPVSLHRAPQEAMKTGAPAAPATTATEVASGQPPEMSPIGQLSTANNDSNAADRQQILDQINATESTLNGIHRSLNGEEQKTAKMIHTFITKAREALKTDDLDGARGYNTKAKILLQELTKE